MPAPPLGYRGEELTVLLWDGHRTVGPVLGVVRDRLLGVPALGRGDLAGVVPGLIRLPGPGGVLRWPRFQFRSGTAEPWPVVSAVGVLLGAEDDPWGVAGWWLSANAWLGTAPTGLLGGHRDGEIADEARFLLEGE
ncbi:hypothetical protein GT204_17710 [Streptomyces sp. SID4919]|nr:hypothetical protein [Streptomyces sp. SID4919]